MKHAILVSILSLAAPPINAVLGADLTAYRLESSKDSAEPRDLEQASADRVQRLRTRLATSSYRFTPPVAPKNGVRHEASSSTFFKQILMKGASGLHKDGNYEKPPTFNPSDFMHEIDEKAARHKLEVCKSSLGSELPRLVDEFRGQLILAKKRQAAATSADAATAKAIGLQLDVYLWRNQPRDQGKSIQDIIGKLYQVQAVDGHVAKLRFTSRGAVFLGDDIRLPDEESLSLTLSMLANFRAGRDRYFLDIQDCFIKYVESEIEARKAEKSKLEDKWFKSLRKGVTDKLTAVATRLAVLEEVRAEAEKKFRGAVFANETLAKLSKAQLHFLIDLFLQLRGRDIPVAREIPAFSMYVSEAQKKALDEQGKALLNGDFIFYKTMHEDLYQLEEHLAEERKAEAQHRAVMDEIRGGAR